MEETEKIKIYKKKAVEFLQSVVAGKIDEVYSKYVDMNGRHHNQYFKAGFPSLKEAMIENHTQFPNKKYEVKNVLGDGNLVAVHGRIIVKPGENEMAVVHLFRFNGDKIVEMWDCGQPLQADSPNADGAF